MKRCPFCAEEIQDAAVICRFCQRDVSEQRHPATQVPPLPRVEENRLKAKNALWTLGILMALGLLGIIIAVVSDDTAPRKVASTTREQYVLELRTAIGRQSSTSYMTVEGEVTNLTGRPLDRVAAVVTWRDSLGGFITSSTSLIEYNPLLAYQSSPFKVITSRNPQMERFTITFRRLGGQDLPFRDTRGQR